MGNFTAAGPELKRLIKFAKKKPMSFAFNPGPKDDLHYFGLHKKKAPRIIMKEAKAEGAGPKAAFGTMSVEGRVLELRCERAIPAMAKKLKRYLKKNRVMLNVVVLDEAGNVLEQDIEELPEDAELDAALDDAAFADDDDDADEGVDAALDPAQVMARMRDVGARLKAVGTPAADLVPTYRDAAERLKSGDAMGADAALDDVEAGLEDLEAAPAAAQGEAPAAAQDDAQSIKLRQAVEALRGRAEALSDTDHRASVMSRLDDASRAIDAGDLAAALELLKSARDALAAPPPDAAPQDDPLAAKWMASFAKVDPIVQSALRDNTFADADARAEFVRQWDWTTAEAADKRYAEALGRLPMIVDLLKAGRAAAPKDAKAADVPPDVRPFAEAQLAWRKTRGQLRAEMDKLKAAIVSVCADDPDLAEAVANVAVLDQEIVKLDKRLEDALIKVTNAAPGKTRDDAKSEARDVLEAYEAELEREFFDDVDDNGFVDIAIAANARDTLAGIRQVLT